MSKRKQHPLIVAMNRFDQLLATLDASNAEAFTAYVRNKVSTRRVPKSTSATAPRAARRSRQSSLMDSGTASSETEKATASSAAGSGNGD